MDFILSSFLLPALGVHFQVVELMACSMALRELFFEEHPVLAESSWWYLEDGGI